MVGVVVDLVVYLTAAEVTVVARSLVQLVVVLDAVTLLVVVVVAVQ